MTTSSKSGDPNITGRPRPKVVKKSTTVTSKSAQYKQGALLKALTTRQRIDRLRVGIDAGYIIPISEHLNISREAIGGIIGISPATMHRKIKAHAKLSPAESERLERITLIEDEAKKVFGDAERAKSWLLSSNNALGSVPLTLLDTDIGTTEVRKVLNAIAYGGVI